MKHMARRLLQPVSRMARLSPALACTCVPGFSLVPLADRVIARVWSSSTATVPLARPRETWCCQSRRRMASRRCWRLIFASRRHVSGACRMRPSLTAIWPTFMSTPVTVPSSGRSTAAMA